MQQINNTKTIKITFNGDTKRMKSTNDYATLYAQA
jgi:hypothetical protein